MNKGHAYIGLVIGAAKRLYSLTGYTDVTPAAVLKSWSCSNHGTYNSIPFGNRWTVTRSMFTGHYGYLFETRDQNGVWHFGSSEPFGIPHMRRQNYFCDLSSQTATFHYYMVENFDLAVWAYTVTKVGLTPPSAPYSTHLKDGAWTLPSGCDEGFESTYGSVYTRNLWINDYGHITTTLSGVNFDYEWPPLVWVGNWYDF